VGKPLDRHVLGRCAFTRSSTARRQVRHFARSILAHRHSQTGWFLLSHRGCVDRSSNGVRQIRHPLKGEQGCVSEEHSVYHTPAGSASCTLWGHTCSHPVVLTPLGNGEGWFVGANNSPFARAVSVKTGTTTGRYGWLDWEKLCETLRHFSTFR